MDNSSNRLYPSIVTSQSTQHQHQQQQHASRHTPQKLTLRRRCRSECLQMAPNISGIPTEPKLFDDLNELRRKVAQPVFRNMLLKYSPSPAMRGQDYSRNIFSMIETRTRTGAQLKHTTKENMQQQQHQQQSAVDAIERNQQHPNSQPHLHQSRHNHYNNSQQHQHHHHHPHHYHYQHTNGKSRSIKQVDNDDSSKQMHLLTTTTTAAAATAFDRNVYDLPTSTLDCINKPQVDNNKRRIRARSESESNEIYSTKVSPNKSVKIKDYDFVLKRSRDDKPSNRNGTSDAALIASGGIQTTLAATPAQIGLSDFDKKSKSVYSHITKTSAINNLSSHAKSTICATPRYPIKSLNGGNRKLKSRTTFTLKSKLNPKPSMVVSNPVPAARCPTPISPSSAGGDNNKVVNDEEESDTGCSSLEDDDDLDDLPRDDYANDSLSDSEDSFNQTTANNSTLLNNKKLSASPSSSLLSASSSASNATTTSASATAFSITTTESVIGGYSTAAPLCPSLFPYVPPYITFASHIEKGPPMPAAVTKVLKWKLTTITPIVIRKVLLNSGFRLLRKTNDWMGVWGKHMKSPCFKTIRSYQKINHIPGTFQIGRKDRVWRNLQVQVGRHGKKEFGFMPRTYIIPHDLKLLRRVWTKYSQRNVKWIIKPPASARGAGIKVVNRWSQIPKRKPLIVQRYVDRPLLINGSKFDLRLYVLITSINPLRVYMHTDGLARFASVKYSEKSDTLHDRYMHLTNYSINKLSTNYSKNEDANACKGHKWTVKSLWTHLASQGVDVSGLWGALRNLVLKTILAGENTINQLSKLNIGSKYNCFELFGIDVLLDSELIPWLLEVNISPSLHSASPLDLHVKGPLVQALLNTALFQVPPRIPIAQQHEIMCAQGLNGTLCYDKRIFVTNLSKTERLKHSQFVQKTLTHREDYLDEIIKNLTPDDVRCLIISEDELARSAPLERIFPSPTSYKYLKFTENPRYYNRLLDAWEHQYGQKREQGIERLRKFCENKIHLAVTPVPVKKDCENEKPKDVGTNDDDNTNQIQTTKTNDSNIKEQLLQKHQQQQQQSKQKLLNLSPSNQNQPSSLASLLPTTTATTKTTTTMPSSFVTSEMTESVSAPSVASPSLPLTPSSQQQQQKSCNTLPIAMRHAILEKLESKIFNNCNNGHNNTNTNGIISNVVQ